ncbi:hypothetical protein WN51_12693 [Melipona quadrifasciata]|uniref:Uncharacterized protein n=1 Tax=Melipona quadrifasciata TaxID=166423 RepID=A0A0N0U5Q0_9HYME|nr:hypothetical protein WN51_12693 [Melipona quadrifasciata]
MLAVEDQKLLNDQPDLTILAQEQIPVAGHPLFDLSKRNYEKSSNTHFQEADIATWLQRGIKSGDQRIEVGGRKITFVLLSESISIYEQKRFCEPGVTRVVKTLYTMASHSLNGGGITSRRLVTVYGSCGKEISRGAASYRDNLLEARETSPGRCSPRYFHNPAAFRVAFSGMPSGQRENGDCWSSPVCMQVPLSIRQVRRLPNVNFQLLRLSMLRINNFALRLKCKLVVIQVDESAANV